MPINKILRSKTTEKDPNPHTNRGFADELRYLQRFSTKVLSGLSIPRNNNSKALEAIIGNMVEANKISFRKDELPMGGVDHNRAINITVKCANKVISQVLVDRLSRVNI